MFRKSNVCVIPELNLGCFGCCGNGYKSKEEIMIGIKKNNLELKDINEFSVRSLCWRRKDLRSSGICRNIILDKDKFVCAVHPSRTGYDDPRMGYCDTRFLCKLAFHFNDMNDVEKKKLFAFLKKKIAKGMDSYEYSILNSEDKLWAEFIKKDL